jgi:hypothetical protein
VVVVKRQPYPKTSYSYFLKQVNNFPPSVAVTLDVPLGDCQG